MDSRSRRKALSPNQTRQCISIKQQLARLIRCANDAESLPGFDGHRQQPPSKVAVDQGQTLTLINHARADGIGLEQIQNDVVDRLMDSSVVGELAWLSVRQVMDAAALAPPPDTHHNSAFRP